MKTTSRRDFIKATGLGTAACMFPRRSDAGPARNPGPNFVVILVDDLGWKDLGCYGSTFHETPHTDRLASEGARFTEAYAASPVCSPTRAGLLTGIHPARLKITDWIGGEQAGLLLPADYRRQLPLEEITLGDALKTGGYATAFIGKWHLGERGFFPENQGFDLNVGGHAAGQPASYFYPYKNPQRLWDVPGLEGGSEGEYLTDRLTDEAVRFISTHREQPFLLFLSHYAVHTPIQSREELAEKYRKKLDTIPPPAGPAYVPERESRAKQHQDNPAYAGMMESLDQSVGRVVSALEESGLAGNTVIILTSDNGGLSTLPGNSPTSNAPLRAGKGWLYEGGIRVPLIIRWPGVTTAGTIITEPVTSMDLYATMMEVVAVPATPERARDGMSLSPLLRGSGNLKREALYWHFPHYHGSGNRPSGAVRAGDYKLIEWFEDGVVELYDLARDPGEKLDLAGRMPDKTNELKEMLHRWRAEVDARMPRPRDKE